MCVYFASVSGAININKWEGVCEIFVILIVEKREKERMYVDTTPQQDPFVLTWFFFFIFIKHLLIRKFPFLGVVDSCVLCVFVFTAL